MLIASYIIAGFVAGVFVGAWLDVKASEKSRLP